MLQLPSPPGIDTDVADERRKVSHALWRFLSDLIAALRNRVPITGSVTFNASTTAAVAFTALEPNASYKVFIGSYGNRTYWASDKTTAGFTANASASNSDQVDWMIVRF